MASADPDDAPKKNGPLAPILALVVGVAATFGLTQFGPLAGILGTAPAAAAVADTAPPVEYGEFTELDGIVVNPRGTDGRRYFMVKVGVEAEDAKTLARLDVLRPAAVDAVIGLLSEQSVETLTDITKRDSLKTQILDRFNEMLGEEGPVSRIYFTQYVLQ